MGLDAVDALAVVPFRATGTLKIVSVAALGIVAYAALAVGNWWSIVRGHGGAHAVTKTAATSVLVLIAAGVGSLDGLERIALVVAVLCCLAGDVALLGSGSERFLAGLSAFALGHVAYVVTALGVGVDVRRALLALPALAVLFGFRFVTQTIPAARRAGGRALGGAVTVYAVVITATVTSVTGASWWAGIGAFSFAVSDWVIGYDRFVRPFRSARLLVMMSYHVGQILLVLGLIAAGS